VRADLINGLDELAMSYTHTREILLGGQVWGEGAPAAMYHGVLLDGRLAGHWTYRRDSRDRPAQILTHPLWEWSGAERSAVDLAVAQFGAFVGGPVAWV